MPADVGTALWSSGRSRPIGAVAGVLMVLSSLAAAAAGLTPQQVMPPEELGARQAECSREVEQPSCRGYAVRRSRMHASCETRRPASNCQSTSRRVCNAS